MHLIDKYQGRQNERVTAGIIMEVFEELKDTFWWVKIKGKCYAPTEMIELKDKFDGLKIGDIQQVDPRCELDRANRILVKMHERRIDFERRIKKYSNKYKP